MLSLIHTFSGTAQPDADPGDQAGAHGPPRRGGAARRAFHDGMARVNKMAQLQTPFSGANAYSLVFSAADGEHGKDIVRRTLADCTAMGISVVRIWAFNDGLLKEVKKGDPPKINYYPFQPREGARAEGQPTNDRSATAASRVIRPHPGSCCVSVPLQPYTHARTHTHACTAGARWSRMLMRTRAHTLSLAPTFHTRHTHRSGQFDEHVFQALDWVISEAGNRGIKLMLTLGNFWTDYGGMKQYLRWSQGLADGTEITNDRIKEFYVSEQQCGCGLAARRRLSRPSRLLGAACTHADRHPMLHRRTTCARPRRTANSSPGSSRARTPSLVLTTWCAGGPCLAFHSVEWAALALLASARSGPM